MPGWIVEKNIHIYVNAAWTCIGQSWFNFDRLIFLLEKYFGKFSRGKIVEWNILFSILFDNNAGKFEGIHVSLYFTI